MKHKTTSKLVDPPIIFVEKKDRILEQLAVPNAEYSDASPKGSVDEGIRDLIGEINGLEGFVTTSSCAGRMSVFVEGRKTSTEERTVNGETEDENDRAEREGGDRRVSTVAAVGGKGGGGNWKFVSHDPVTSPGVDGVRRLFGLDGNDESEGLSEKTSDREMKEKDKRLIHFKFEPMILHVLTASLSHAQLLLRCGLVAGFRESGAINITSTSSEPVTPIVAIRSMGLSFESLIGVQIDGVTQCTVSDEYLANLLDIANERFEENKKRIERFRTAVLEATSPPKKKDGSMWEDPEARRERMRAEGLRRKAEVDRQEAKEAGMMDEALYLEFNNDLT
ncbi:methyltransferase TYW3-domain-containing protein [Xylariaceae sp. FL1019]|nr:methyltransferase TYW3-domain-containing protein [Xylariaceae sp. FL1019]